jgi:hypothetical protein
VKHHRNNNNLLKKKHPSPHHARHRSPQRVLMSSAHCLDTVLPLSFVRIKETNIIILTLRIATAATAASLGSGTSDPLLTSGHVLPGMQPAPSSPISDQGHGHGHSHGLSQSPGQSQIRPLSPTPTAELASCVQNAWAGLCDRLGLRSSSPTSASAPAPPSPVPDVPHPSPKPEQAPPTTAASASLSMSPADPYTQFLADMARTFQMGMGMDDTSPGTGTGSKSGAAGAQVQQASSPANAIEVNFVDG